MPDDKHRLYLRDLGLTIKQRALEAVKERDSEPQGSSGRAFQSGRVLALNEVISIMQQDAEGFGIPLADLQLGDIVPDKDLV